MRERDSSGTQGGGGGHTPKVRERGVGGVPSKAGHYTLRRNTAGGGTVALNCKPRARGPNLPTEPIPRTGQMGGWEDVKACLAGKYTFHWNVLQTPPMPLSHVNDVEWDRFMKNIIRPPTLSLEPHINSKPHKNI